MAFKTVKDDCPLDSETFAEEEVTTTNCSAFFSNIEVANPSQSAEDDEFDSEDDEVPLRCPPFLSNIEVPHPDMMCSDAPFFSNIEEPADPSEFAEDDEFDHNFISGFKLLLSVHHHFNPTQHTLLGLKIIMETNHKKIVGELEEAAVATHGKDLLAYELEAKEAIELLLDYGEYWTHSCSITFTEASRLVETNLTSDIRNRENPENNESDTDYAKVMLFVIIDGQIDDKDISDCKLLKMFLNQIMEKIIKVHVTCSSTGKQEEHPLNSHLIISESKYLECLELEI